MKRFVFFVVFSVLSATMASSALARTEYCRRTSKQEILALFERWNDALKTGIPEKVVALYAAKSVLLPTVSNIPRETRAQKLDYFEGFLKRKPAGHIDYGWVELDCNTAIDTGLYTFTYGDGTSVKARFTYTYKFFDKARKWLITSHHSSQSPE